MTRPPLFQGFDGLFNLSRREGVDIKPTLLRVLTDLFVQTSAHSADEARQFVELISRLIDEVDDATRAAVRARLAAYPATPSRILEKLGLRPATSQTLLAETVEAPHAGPIPPRPLPELARRAATHPAMAPQDAAEVHKLFALASGRERLLILDSLANGPLKPAPPVPERLAKRAIETLEMAAFAADVDNFKLEVGESLTLPLRLASEIVDDAGGEPLAIAMRALAMPGAVFQRVLLFLKAEIGTSVHMVYRLSRLYDRLGERPALVMLAAWRGATATRARFRPVHYDDERQRGRGQANAHLARNPVQGGANSVQGGVMPAPRTGTDDS